MKLKEHIIGSKCRLAILIDPDDFWKSEEKRKKMIQVLSDYPPAIVLVGGSLLSDDYFDRTISTLKNKIDAPIVIFPGDMSQVSPKADAILHLTLISGRNPEFLIGQQVRSALKIRKSNLEVLPTGYILIGDCDTSVAYMSNTQPIPFEKDDIVVATALAGIHQGARFIYLEAGSGAKKSVSFEAVKQVSSVNEGITIVGGGISNLESYITFIQSGADLVVIGNAFAKNPESFNNMLAYECDSV